MLSAESDEKWVVVGELRDKMDFGVRQSNIALINFDFCPLFSRTGIEYIGQIYAVFEGTFSDFGYTCGNDDTLQTDAVPEGTFPNFSYAIRDLHVFQLAAGKCTLSEFGDTAGNVDVAQINTVPKCAVFNTCHAVGEFDGDQIDTAGKCTLANAGNTVWDGNALQAAPLKGTVTDTRLRPLGRAMLSKLTQPSKTEASISVTLSGIVILVRWEQPWNAQSLISDSFAVFGRQFCEAFKI